MAETLTEVDSFDTGIVVADGDDWMDDAAEVVARMAQKLVNRTYNLSLHKAAIDVANTFTQPNVFTKATSVQGASLNVQALDANTAAVKGTIPDASADFTHYVQLDSGGAGLGVAIYTGSSGASLGGFVIAYNATWTKGVGWTQTVAGQPSIALIFRYGDVRLVGKPAGSGTWASWPQNTLSAFGATMLSQLFRAAHMEVTANTNADNTQGYRYTGGPVLRTSTVPMGSIFGNVILRGDGSVMHNPAITGDPDQVWIPLRVPTFCHFQEVRIRFVEAQPLPTPNDAWYFYKRTGTGSWVLQDGPFTAGGGPGEKVMHLNTGGDTPVLDGEEWAVRWVQQNAANAILGVELDWLDIGPTNRIG